MAEVPKLLSSALAGRNWPLLAMTLDLLVPPLALLVLTLLGLNLVTWLAYLLFATVLVHVGAALMHAWVRRDGVFEAMAGSAADTSVPEDPASEHVAAETRDTSR